MAEASTKLRPTLTKMAIKNICNRFSRSLFTSWSISPAALAMPIAPMTAPFCRIGVATVKMVCPLASMAGTTTVCPASVWPNNCRTRSCEVTVSAPAGAPPITRAMPRHAPASISVMNVPPSAGLPRAALLPRSAPSDCATRTADGSKTKTSDWPRRSSSANVLGASTPSAVAKFTGVPAGTCASNTSAINSTSVNNEAAR